MNAFIGKAINRAQRLSIEDGGFCAALNEFLVRLGLIVWDDNRALFWIKHPADGWQVAVWLMPVASNYTTQSGATG